MQQSELVPLRRLSEERYCQVLCYPRYDLEEMRERLVELRKLGVEVIEFTGERTVFGVPVLGKGCVGIVVAVHTSLGKGALKIRRVDADRAGMQHEAEMLRRANAVNIGPKLLNVTKNFLLMQFIEGAFLPEWVEGLSGEDAKSRICRVLKSILEQCNKLDEVGLDHGELSNAAKHIIIDAGTIPHLVDFETASTSRRVSNLTSVCHYLFLGSRAAKTIRTKLGEVDKEDLVDALRSHKKKPTQESFEKILAACRIG